MDYPGEKERIKKIELEDADRLFNPFYKLKGKSGSLDVKRHVMILKLSHFQDLMVLKIHLLRPCMFTFWDVLNTWLLTSCNP
jgi:hypothetical protein